MDISFSSKKLGRQCSCEKERDKAFGACGRLVGRRLDDLSAASCLEDMRNLPGKCHELSTDRAGQLAIHLSGNFRLVFAPVGEPPAKPDGGLDWAGVTAVLVIDVVDYHG